MKNRNGTNTTLNIYINIHIFLFILVFLLFSASTFAHSLAHKKWICESLDIDPTKVLRNINLLKQEIESSGLLSKRLTSVEKFEIRFLENLCDEPTEVLIKLRK